MKLLIVDDQLVTLMAISHKIDWAREGIQEVVAAQNAMEARIAFKKGAPDIMICDIEMPVESGMELCRWVREMDYPTRVIFLTCHSEFTYAKEAIELKAVDYILQPAPYEEIVEVVRKAVQDVKESDKWQKELNRTKDYDGKNEYIRKSLWRDYLLETIGQDSLPPTGFDKEQDISLTLLQLVGWREQRERWNDALLMDILTSFMMDIFPPDSYHQVLVAMGNDTCALLLQSPKEKKGSEAELSKQLKFLCAAFDLYMPCAVACYSAESRTLAYQPAIWKELLKQKDSNVADKSGLFTTSRSTSVKVLDFLDSVRQWNHYLCTGHAEKMELEATGLLNRIAEGGDLDAQNLMHFYQDFMQMLYQVGLEEEGKPVAQLFGTEDEMELYRNGMKSLKHMVALIRHVAVQYRTDGTLAVPKETVERIKRYINSHLDQNIAKDEITQLIHLNPDYVTRLFKKETGMSIKSYIIQQKMLEAQNLLKNTTLSISHIAVRLGYSNFSHFSVTYKKQFGISPMEEKRSHE